MPKSTSVVLEDEHEIFIQKRIASGANKSASEVMREALENLRRDEAEEVAWREILESAMKSPRAEPGVFERIFAKHGIPEHE
jgi:putative addiction module CopG family antidote